MLRHCGCVRASRCSERVYRRRPPGRFNGLRLPGPLRRAVRRRSGPRFALHRRARSPHREQAGGKGSNPPCPSSACCQREAGKTARRGRDEEPEEGSPNCIAREAEGSDVAGLFSGIRTDTHRRGGACTALARDASIAPCTEETARSARNVSVPIAASTGSGREAGPSDPVSSGSKNSPKEKDLAAEKILRSSEGVMDKLPSTCSPSGARPCRLARPRDGRLAHGR